MAWLSDFRAWMLADLDRAPSYAGIMARRLRYLAGAGLDWGVACRSPDSCRNEARGILAGLKESGRVHMARNCAKALNLYAKWQATRDARWRGEHWTLPSVPPHPFEPYTPGEVARLAAAAATPGFRGARRACLVWLLANGEWRRAELWGATVEDVDPERSAILVRHPEKGGDADWVLLPRAAWAKGMPLPRYLAARARRVRRDVQAFWITQHGHPLSLGGFNGDMQDLRRLSGVACNFNRFRHTRGTIYEEANAPLVLAQRAFRHKKPESTFYYMHGSQEARRAALARLGLPGFADEAQTLGMSRWDRLGLPGSAS